MENLENDPCWNIARHSRWSTISHTILMLNTTNETLKAVVNSSKICKTYFEALFWGHTKCSFTELF